MTIPFRPLGLIASVVEALGFQVSYAYDDLVFITHNAFLLRMEDEGEDVFLYFNEACEVSARQPIVDHLTSLATHKELVIHEAGTFAMSQKDTENLNIQFYDYELT